MSLGDHSMRPVTLDQSLASFHEKHCGAVLIKIDKYLATRSSHSAQYCRCQTYSNAIKICFIYSELN